MTTIQLTRRVLPAALGLLALSGCAGPLLVYGIQSRDAEVKFGYTQQGTDERGIIECEVPEGGGDLQNCRKMHVEFVE